MAWFKEEAFPTLQPLQNSLSVLEGKEDQPVSLVVTLAEVVDAITFQNLCDGDGCPPSILPVAGNYLVKPFPSQPISCRG